MNRINFVFVSPAVHFTEHRLFAFVAILRPGCRLVGGGRAGTVEEGFTGACGEGSGGCSSNVQAAIAYMQLSVIFNNKTKTPLSEFTRAGV